MRSKIRVNASIVIIGLTLLLFGFLGLDHFYRQKIENFIDTMIHTHRGILENNNYYQFEIHFDRIKEIDSALGSAAIYVQGHRKSGNSTFSLVFDYQNAPPPMISSIKMLSLFSYRVDYVFENQDYVLSFNYQDPNRTQITFEMIFFVLLLFGIHIVLHQILDIDRTRRNTLEFAISQSAKAIHFVKTHLHSADELHAWISSRSLPKDRADPEIQELLEEFSNSRIEMVGLSSILRLDKYTGPKEQTDIKEMIETLVHCYTHEKLQIQTFFDTGLPSLSIDKDVFIAIVGNLIKNACDYSDGFVWIRCLFEKKGLIISVSNTGKYLSAREIKKILLPGHSPDGSSGLGLTICQAWVEKIGSKLEIASNRGCNTFQVRFALQSVAAAPSPETLKPNLLKNGSTALILEDSLSFRNSLRRDFGALGFDVKEFESSEPFFNFLSKNPGMSSLIIVDRHMRGFDAVRDRFPAACRYYGFKGKIVLVTADLSSVPSDSAGNQFDAIVIKGDSVDWKLVLAQIEIQ